MIDIDEYIRQAKENDVSDYLITLSLLEKKIKEPKIKAALARARKDTPSPNINFREETPEKHHYLTPIFLLILILVGSVGATYFMIQTNKIEKPTIEKPTESFTLTEDHIKYLFNELNFYKLKKHPISHEIPFIELNVRDTGKTYYIQINRNTIDVITTKTNLQDIIITVDSITLLEIIDSDNIIEEFQKRKDAVFIERTVSDNVLQKKGYFDLEIL